MRSLISRSCAARFIAALPTVAAGAGAAAPSLPVDLVSLASCRRHESGDSIRVIVFTRGFEHVSSQVRVEWIARGEQGGRVERSVAVPELNSGMWSVGGVSVLRGRSCVFRIEANHTYGPMSGTFTLRANAPGRYALDSDIHGEESR